MTLSFDRDETFLDVGSKQYTKDRQFVCGDNFISKSYDSGRKTISVLCDGLGSGIKASVLSTLSSVMAVSFARNDVDLHRASKTIMAILPVCPKRKIAYSTFTIISVEHTGLTRIIEYENPKVIIIRDNLRFVPDEHPFEVTVDDRVSTLFHSSFMMKPSDRIIYCTDGVTQASMGSHNYPLGLGEHNLQKFIIEQVEKTPLVASTDLATRIADLAFKLDGMRPKDDITASVLYLRHARRTAVFTGPPLRPSSDKKFSEIAKNFEGRKIICGGTTAEIISRECERKIFLDIDDINSEVPPRSNMMGFDLVTEGTVTLGVLLNLLMNNQHEKTHAAGELLSILQNSDIIHFFVGTKVNEAHQDPNLPEELELRRNLVKRIKENLEQSYHKKVLISYF